MQVNEELVRQITEAVMTQLRRQKDASGTEAVAAVAYRCGNFNPDEIIVGEGYTLADADKDTLRKYDIVFTEMLKA